MTNYNERLDELLSKTPCIQCDGSGAYPDYDGEPEQCQFCWQLRFTFIATAKQAITSLIKELVAEAKPSNVYKTSNGQAPKVLEAPAHAYDVAIQEFEQNLLKALEEV